MRVPACSSSRGYSSRQRPGRLQLCQQGVCADIHLAASRRLPVLPAQLRPAGHSLSAVCGCAHKAAAPDASSGAGERSTQAGPGQWHQQGTGASGVEAHRPGQPLDKRAARAASGVHCTCMCYGCHDFPGARLVVSAWIRRCSRHLSQEQKRQRPLLEYRPEPDLAKALEEAAASERAGGGDAAGKPRLHLVVLGHVDAGKSTLMGRLLHDLGWGICSVN